MRQGPDGCKSALRPESQLPGTEIQWRQFGLEFEGATKYSVPIAAGRATGSSMAGIRIEQSSRGPP